MLFLPFRSEVKKEFGNDAKKYLDWELGVLETGLKMTGSIEMLNILNKYRKLYKFLEKHLNYVIKV